MSGYLSFNRTGIPSVDNLIDVIESAGDGYHNTADWSEENKDGKSSLNLIQEAIDKLGVYVKNRTTRTQDTGSAEEYASTICPRFNGLGQQNMRWGESRRDFLAGQHTTQDTGEMEVCVWTYDDDSDSWDGTCGVKWILSDGTPKEHDMKFCPRCGAVLKAKEGKV